MLCHIMCSSKTLRPRQNCHHFTDQILKYIILKENVWILLKISLKFVPKVWINYIPALIQIMAWHRSGDKLLSEPRMISLWCVYASLSLNELTHWGRVTHICVSKLTIIGSDNGLSPGRRLAIIWTNAGILLIRILGTNFSEILSKINAFAFKKIHLKMSSAKWRPFCLRLNVLTLTHRYTACRSYQQKGNVDLHYYISSFAINHNF